MKNCKAADGEQLAVRPEGSGGRHRLLQQLLIGVELGASRSYLAGRVCNLTMCKSHLSSLPILNP